jgi:hypothetical protein
MSSASIFFYKSVCLNKKDSDVHLGLFFYRQSEIIIGISEGHVLYLVE